MDGFGLEMKVAEQSCSLVKVANVAKVASTRKHATDRAKPRNSTVANRKLLQSSPYKGGTLQFWGGRIKGAGRDLSHAGLLDHRIQEWMPHYA